MTCCNTDNSTVLDKPESAAVIQCRHVLYDSTCEMQTLRKKLTISHVQSVFLGETRSAYFRFREFINQMGFIKLVIFFHE